MVKEERPFLFRASEIMAAGAPVAPVAGVDVDPLDTEALPGEPIAEPTEESAVRPLQEQEGAPCPRSYLLAQQPRLAQPSAQAALPATQPNQPTRMDAISS